MKSKPKLKMNKHRSYLSVFALIFASVAFAVPKSGLSETGEKGFAIIGTAGVASASVGTAGTGYTSLPAITFTGGGGGSGTVSTATLKVVGSVTVTAAGTGYTVGDVLTVVGGTRTTAATVTVATITGGGGTGPVGSYTLTNAGVYTVPITAAATTTGGTGTGATVTVGYGVGTLVFTNAGGGYTSAPTVVITGGGGSSAAATATLNGDATALNTIKFKAIIPISSTVIESITFPTAVPGTSVHTGDVRILGKTLAANVEYPLYGSSIKLTSGVAYLVRR